MRFQAAVVLFIASIVTVTASDIEKAWKLDTAKLSLDPSSWDTTIKEKIFKVAVGVVYAISLGFPFTYAGAFGLFLFGLVKISWPLILTACLALYGYRTKKALFLGAGMAGTYWQAFGLSF